MYDEEMLMSSTSLRHITATQIFFFLLRWEEVISLSFHLTHHCHSQCQTQASLPTSQRAADARIPLPALMRWIPFEMPSVCLSPESCEDRSSLITWICCTLHIPEIPAGDVWGSAFFHFPFLPPITIKSFHTHKLMFAFWFLQRAAHLSTRQKEMYFFCPHEYFCIFCSSDQQVGDCSVSSFAHSPFFCVHVEQISAVLPP